MIKLDNDTHIVDSIDEYLAVFKLHGMPFSRLPDSYPTYTVYDGVNTLAVFGVGDKPVPKTKEALTAFKERVIKYHNWS